MPSRQLPLLVQYRGIQPFVRADGKSGENDGGLRLTPCTPNTALG